MFFAQNKNYPKAKITINSPIDKAFSYIVPVKLSHIFKRYKRFLAIIKTNETEIWNKPGLAKTVFFEDGTTAQEHLIFVIPNKFFSYEIDSFTSPLRLLAKKIEGDWLFTDIGNQ